MISASVGDSARLKELLSPRLPFGLPSGKMTMSGPYQPKHQASMQQYANSFVNAKISSPRISQDNTTALTSQLMP